MMFLDLDGFKLVNDTQGHSGGDALLKEVGARLRSCVRPTDTSARLAGDEFTIILTDLEARAAAELVAQRILAALCHPYQVNGRNVSVSASIGISMFPADGDYVATLVREADRAVSLAKAAGKNRVAFAHGA